MSSPLKPTQPAPSSPSLWQRLTAFFKGCGGTCTSTETAGQKAGAVTQRIKSGFDLVISNIAELDRFKSQSGALGHPEGRLKCKQQISALLDTYEAYLGTVSTGFLNADFIGSRGENKLKVVEDLIDHFNSSAKSVIEGTFNIDKLFSKTSESITNSLSDMENAIQNDDVLSRDQAKTELEQIKQDKENFLGRLDGIKKTRDRIKAIVAKDVFPGLFGDA